MCANGERIRDEIVARVDPLPEKPYFFHSENKGKYLSLFKKKIKRGDMRAQTLFSMDEYNRLSLSNVSRAHVKYKIFHFIAKNNFNAYFSI